MGTKNDKVSEDIFQELYELLLEEADGKKPAKKKTNQEKFESTPDLTDFLENEFIRLIKLNHFLSIKLENLKKNSQTTELVRRQKKEIFVAKTELINKMCKEEGHFQKQMAYLWDKTFA